jgi:hypothetical protein
VESISAPVRNVSPFVQSVASHFIDWAIPATQFLYLSAFNVDDSSIGMIWWMKWRIILYSDNNDNKGSKYSIFLYYIFILLDYLENTLFSLYIMLHSH